MHDTARCLGYPSDSTRAARERASGDNLQSPCCPPTRPGGSPLAPVAQLSPRWLNSRTPGRRRRIATSHGPWAYSLWLLAGVSDQIRPLRHCRRHRRAVGGGPKLARAAGGLRRAVYSLSPGRRRRLATSHSVGLGRTVWAARVRVRSNQTPTSLPSSSARSGGRAWPGTDCGRYSRRVVILGVWCQWHWPSPVRVQLGRRRCGGSPASRGLAGLGDTGLSAARLRAGTTVEAPSALPAASPRRAHGARSSLTS
jgi:hypothetical protein